MKNLRCAAHLELLMREEIRLKESLSSQVQGLKSIRLNVTV